MSESLSNEFPQVNRLLEIMVKLRDPEQGCPWDKQQDFASIVPYTIEEAYEVADAIENGDMEEVKDELGDLLFQVVFYAQLGKEQRLFDFESIAETIADKLVRRHPHVFTNMPPQDAKQVEQNWQSIKKQEREAKSGPKDVSVLANIPSGLPPLIRAQKIQNKCAQVGFDWVEIAPVVEKIEEEIQEVMEEVNQSNPCITRVEEEIGDLLFAVVNLSRHLNIDAETALRKGNRKFEKRFRAVEQELDKQSIPLDQASLEQMELIWQQIKQRS